jgi:D-sedoheptulose 7-phosphate isomerase
LTDFSELIIKMLNQSVDTIKKSISLTSEINATVDSIVNSIQNGNKLVIFGNGGSAADAQHISAELIGRYKLERKSFPAISLTTDSSIITSLSNDYSYDIIFARQCESLVLNGDVVLGISTSGNSVNVLEGLKTSKTKGAITIGLLGNGGGKIKSFVDIPVIVNSNNTARIQEVHRVLYHIICELVEKELVKENNR